jgi:hypothetical protein
MTKSKLVEIWSTYPPPYGGVSVHSMRLYETLKINQSVKLVFKDFNGLEVHQDNHIIKVNNFPYEFCSLLFKRNRIIHLHSNNLNLWIAIGLLIFRHSFIITIHNQNLRTITSRIKNFLLKIFLKKVKYLILNDSDLSEFLLAKFHLKKEKIKILPAFIPPLESEQIGLNREFIEFRNKYKFVVSTFAWKLYKKNGIDVYGIREIIQAVQTLISRGYSIGLIAIIPIIEDLNYFNELLKEISEFNLEDYIFIYTQNMTNAFEVWKMSNVFVRATSTDIEGLTIKEALYYDIPVVASDVVKRPKDAILYEFGNLDDLTEKISSALNIKDFKCYQKEPDPCAQILSLYELLNMQNSSQL